MIGSRNERSEGFSTLNEIVSCQSIQNHQTSAPELNETYLLFMYAILALTDGQSGSTLLYFYFLGNQSKLRIFGLVAEVGASVLPKNRLCKQPSLFFNSQLSHQYLTKVQCWNKRFGCETIHPTQKFTSMNLLQMSCMIAWA